MFTVATAKKVYCIYIFKLFHRRIAFALKLLYVGEGIYCEIFIVCIGETLTGEFNLFCDIGSA